MGRTLGARSRDRPTTSNHLVAGSEACGGAYQLPARALPLQKKREKPNESMTYEECIRKSHVQYRRTLDVCQEAYRRRMKWFLWSYAGHLICGWRLAVCKGRAIRDYQLCLQKCLEQDDELMARIALTNLGLAQPYINPPSQ